MGRRERTAEQPDGEIERVFSGLRPGEKLFEKLLTGDDPHSLHGQALLPSRSHKRNKCMAQTYGANVWRTGTRIGQKSVFLFALRPCSRRTTLCLCLILNRLIPTKNGYERQYL